MMVELGDASVTDGAMLRTDRSPEQAGAAKCPPGRIKMIPLTPFRQLDDGPEPLLLRHDDDARI